MILVGGIEQVILLVNVLIIFMKTEFLKIVLNVMTLAILVKQEVQIA